MKKQPIDYVIEYLEQINDIKNFMKNRRNNDLADDKILRNAVAMSMQTALENIVKLYKIKSDFLEENYPDVKWNKIIGFRNILAHDYGTLNIGLFCETYIYDLPSLTKVMEEVKDTLSNHDEEEDKSFAPR